MPVVPASTDVIVVEFVLSTAVTSVLFAIISATRFVIAVVLFAVAPMTTLNAPVSVTVNTYVSVPITTSSNAVTLPDAVSVPDASTFAGNAVLVSIPSKILIPMYRTDSRTISITTVCIISMSPRVSHKNEFAFVIIVPQLYFISGDCSPNTDYTQIGYLLNRIYT